MPSPHKSVRGVTEGNRRR